MPLKQPPGSLEWMFSGLGRAGRVGLPGGAKASVPSPTLAAVKKLGAESIAPEAWEPVRRQGCL